MKQLQINTFFRFILIILIPLTMLFCKNETKSSMAVMAYYVPSNNFNLEEISFEKLTHIIFSFTEVIDNQMKFNHEESSQKLKPFRAHQ